jgi:hypothetical protein
MPFQKFMQSLFGEKTNQPSPVPSDDSKDKPLAIEEANDENDLTEEIIAAITAAVYAVMGVHDESSEIVVRTIRRTGKSSPSWNLAGREEVFASRR